MKNINGEGEKKHSGNFFGNMAKWFKKMGTMDKVIMITGTAVLILAIITGSIYLYVWNEDRQLSGLSNLGQQLAGIRLPGEEGILAVANARIARLEGPDIEEVVFTPEPEPEDVEEYDEIEYIREIDVTLNMTSIQKDLKIKFINKDNSKLIANVPFSVTITDPDKNTVVWKDDDRDGIVHQKDIKPGRYTVSVNKLEDERYDRYLLPDSSATVEVKSEIVYKMVDVSDEIKTEAEIDVSQEDVGGINSGSPLVNTVEWVESKVIPVTYEEVLRSTVPDPIPLVLESEAAKRSYTGGISENRRILSVGESFALAATGVNTNLYNVIWSSSNSAIASVSSSGSVFGVAMGFAWIEYSLQDISIGTGIDNSIGNGSVSDGDTTSSSSIIPSVGGCLVWVAPSLEGNTTPLKDKDGAGLFVLDNGNYREAVYSDYSGTGQFFINAGPGYTGWQTLEGKVYFFDKNGKKVTGEHVILGVPYHFASDGSLVVGSGTTGIDVSKWNGNIDWNAVKNAGISFVIIRCGYRGYTQGSLIIDPMFHTNIKGATAAGLKVGVYFFTQAIDEREAIEEASMVLGLVKDYKISYPIFLDVEASGGRADVISKSTRTAVCIAFAETIRSAGYTPGIYANRDWLTNRIDASRLNPYKIWLAQYAARPTYTGRYDLWQYTSTGRVNGISGNVDMNISYLGY